MKYKIILSVMIMISSSQVFAEEIRDVYDRDTIYLYRDYLGDWFVKNGLIMSLGPFGSNLKTAMIESKFANEEMQKAQKYKKIGFATGAIATILGVTDIILEITDTKYSHKRSISVPLIITSAVIGTVSKGFNQSATGAMNRAVWLYNRDVMLNIK